VACMSDAIGHQLIRDASAAMVAVTDALHFDNGSSLRNEKVAQRSCARKARPRLLRASL